VKKGDGRHNVAKDGGSVILARADRQYSILRCRGSPEGGHRDHRRALRRVHRQAGCVEIFPGPATLQRDPDGTFLIQIAKAGSMKPGRGALMPIATGFRR
jgi:hypothetical protein